MKRLVLLLVLTIMVPALSAAGATAHPLGNFTVNHLTQVSVDRDTVQLR